MSVASVLGSGWKGGRLVQLESAVTKATADELVLNYCWVKPFVERFRDRIPSSFFVTDVFLYLDKLWIGGLQIPVEEGESKKDLAAEEAKRIKNLMGALRGLWRSSVSVSKVALLYFQLMFGIFL